MDIFLSFTIPFILIFLFSLYYVLWGSKIAKRNNKIPPLPPQAGGAWPIIGHLHLLGGPQVPHKTLASMVDKYGPIFTLKFGVHQLLVVSDSNLAKECYTTNDKAFANRPKSISAELMCYDHRMLGLDPYGPYWRKLKKIVVNGVLSKTQIAGMENVRVTEVRASLKRSYQYFKNSKRNNEVARTEMKDWFGRTVLNMVLKMVIGTRYSINDERVKFEKALKDITTLLGTFVVGDMIPWIRWLDIGGYEKRMKKCFVEIDLLLQGALEEHKRKRSILKIGDNNEEEKDFMDVILSSVDGISHEELGGDPDFVTKSTCLALLLGGVETTVVTLTWALSLLLNNKHTLKMVQEEIDLHVGKDRQVEESDVKNLVYLQSVLKETLRLIPPAPFALPHESMEDCIVGGYNVPRGTHLFVNLWKIHHDPHVWSDPDEFRPERFLTAEENVDYRGQNFKLIPFGSGRRPCPGISLASQNIHLVLASLIHEFEVSTVSGEPIDMTESFGSLLILKATPLEVILNPRLSPNLYE